MYYVIIPLNLQYISLEMIFMNINLFAIYKHKSANKKFFMIIQVYESIFDICCI